MYMMTAKKVLEHKVALLTKLLELEHDRLVSERDRANQWQAESERKDQIIESLKLPSEQDKSIKPDWRLIKKHFNELLEEEGIPYKHVKDSGKKRIRREANDRAAIENTDVCKYSDNELSRELKFPQKPMLRRFARQLKKK
jgi:hypothetical protein